MTHDRIGPGRAVAIICAMALCGWCIGAVLSADRTPPLLYLYNLPPPQLRLVDEIGRIALTITLPQSTPPGEARIASGSSASWTSDRGGRTVVNTVERIGVLLEMRSGNGAWAPLHVPGVADQGLVRMRESDQATLTIATTEPWVSHSYRARTLIAATGYPLGGRPGPSDAVPDETVLVYDGIYPTHPVPWPGLAFQVEQGLSEVQRDHRLLLGDERSPTGVAARPGIRYYHSAVSREIAGVPLSDTRVAFLRAIDVPGDPRGEGAELLITHLIRDSRNQDGHWLTTPIRCIVHPGDPIAVERDVPDPVQHDTLKVHLELAVPYRFVDVQHAQTRYLAYIVRPVARRPPRQGKDLEVLVKQCQTDAVVLRDAAGDRVTLPQLLTTRLPQYHDAFAYPAIPSGDNDERLAFSSAPGTFRQRGLAPTPPIAHEPGTGPLEDRRLATGDQRFATDTTSWELADGRLVYWSPATTSVKVLILPGCDSDTAAARDADPGPAAP